MCAAAFEALGVPYYYTAIDLPSERDLLRALGDLRSGLISGANVTVPYKKLAFEHADKKDESAAEVGVANVLVTDNKRRLIAYNTDAEALTQELEVLLGERSRQRAVIVGGGGAGLAALSACKQLGFKVICMTSRSWTTTEKMYESPGATAARDRGALTVLWPDQDTAPTSKSSQVLRLQWSELSSQADCIIQATSAGMAGASPGEDVSRVVPWDQVPRHAVAYDVVYNPIETVFLRDARARGLRAEGGLGMLVRQAWLSIRLWTGAEAPLRVMRAAAEQALSSFGGKR